MVRENCNECFVGTALLSTSPFVTENYRLLSSTNMKLCERKMVRENCNRLGCCIGFSFCVCNGLYVCECICMYLCVLCICLRM